MPQATHSQARRTESRSGTPKPAGKGVDSGQGQAHLPRYLQAAEAPLIIQRDGDGSAVSQPSFQLTPPSLLQPRDPLARFLPQFNLQLKLDPTLQQQMQTLLQSQLAPSAITSLVASGSALAIPGAAGGGPASNPQPGAGQQTSSAPAGTPAPSATPSPPVQTGSNGSSDQPAVVTQQRTATGGDVLSAVTALPQVQGLLNNVKDQALSGLSRDWSNASTPGKVGIVGGSVFIAGSLLGPVLGARESRNAVLPLLSDVLLPIPKLDGYALEYHFGDGGVGVGAHVDLGQYLPSAWGFGLKPLQSFSDQARDLSQPPVSRKEDRDDDGHLPLEAQLALGQQIRTASGRGAALDAGLARQFGNGLGADLSAVRIHRDAEADGLARALQARAFTSGQDIFFRAGHYDPASASGRRLIAHEVTHTVQQARARAAMPVQKPAGGLAVSQAGDPQEREADASAEAITQPASVQAPGTVPVKPAQSTQPAAAIQREGDGSAKTLRPDVKKMQPAPAGSKAVATALHCFLFNANGTIVATVDPGTELKVTAMPSDEDSAALADGSFWQRPPSNTPEQLDIFYEVEYFGRMGAGAKDRPIKGYVLTNWVSLGGSPAGPSTAMTANDWMSAIPDNIGGGNKEAITAAAKAIQAERAAIEARPFTTVKKKDGTIPRDGLMSAPDDKTRAYETWLNEADTRPSLARDTSDVRWLAFRKLFPAEGNPSTIMTYDNTNITWGVGFSGAGDGGVALTEQMMARLFRQSAEARDAFWRAGIAMEGTVMVAVQIMDAAAGKAVKLRGTRAENFVREQQALLSLMTNISLGLDTASPSGINEGLRQEVLNAQFETFLNNTLANSEGIIDGMKGDPKAAAVAAHSVHSGQHSWGQYTGATSLGAVESAIDRRIEAMKKLNADKEAKGEKKPFPFIVPRAQIEANIN